MAHWHRLTGPLRVTDGGPLALPAALEQRVADHWTQALTESPQLFDGATLTVARLAGNSLAVRQMSYRHVIAARRDPVLARALKLRSLAVSGILRCPDGVVFGQRAAHLAADGGCWELVPSGGAAQPDLRRQIGQELQEELGLTPDQVTILDPVAVVVDGPVLDVVFPLWTDQPAKAILAIHRDHASDEYSRLEIAGRPDDFAARHPDLIVASRLIIDRLGTTVP